MRQGGFLLCFVVVEEVLVGFPRREGFSWGMVNSSGEGSPIGRRQLVSLFMIL